MTGFEGTLLAIATIALALVLFCVYQLAAYETQCENLGKKYIDLFRKHEDLSKAFDNEERSHDMWRAKAMGLQARMDAIERGKQKKDPLTGRWIKKVPQ